MEEKEVSTAPKSANPAPLGLLGFGMTTVLLNIHNTGLTEITAVIAAMGCALGGLAQFVAGLLEFKKGNTFGGTAFTAYGLFWISLVLIWTNPFAASAFTSTNTVKNADNVSMGFYLLLWGLFTGAMFVGALKHNTISKIVFGSLVVLFLMLSIGNFAQAEVVVNIAGYVGILCGLSAIYSAFAQIINEEYKRKVCPLT